MLLCTLMSTKIVYDGWKYKQYEERERYTWWDTIKWLWSFVKELTKEEVEKILNNKNKNENKYL
jgi:hypothetical protein